VLVQIDCSEARLGQVRDVKVFLRKLGMNSWDSQGPTFVLREGDLGSMNHTVTHCCSFGDGRDGVALKMNIKPCALRAEGEGDQILLRISLSLQG
jgi:hypothetical protein